MSVDRRKTLAEACNALCEQYEACVQVANYFRKEGRIEEERVTRESALTYGKAYRAVVKALDLYDEALVNQ